MNITLQYKPISTYGLVYTRIDKTIVMSLSINVPIYGKKKAKKFVNYTYVHPKSILTVDDTASYLAIKKSYYFLGNPS